MPSAACAERRDRNSETVADKAAELALADIAVELRRRRRVTAGAGNSGVVWEAGWRARLWAVLRRGEILANWERARRNGPLLGIDPLA